MHGILSMFTEWMIIPSYRDKNLITVIFCNYFFINPIIVVRTMIIKNNKINEIYMNVIWKRSYSLKKNKSSTSLLLEDTAFHFKNFFLIKKLKKCKL